MTYAEILAEVKLLSKRGDVDDKIVAAVRMVTLRAHRLDFFWRDRIEAQVSWVAAATLVDINVQTYLPRFRAADYIRYYDPATLVLGNMLDSISPRDILDEYNYEKLDRWYMAGDVMKLKFAYPTFGAQIGYFCSPLVTPTTYSSWIADQFPDLIIQGALAQVFNWTGKQEEARALNVMVGFDVDPGRSGTKGASMVEQLKQWALEEQAR